MNFISFPGPEKVFELIDALKHDDVALWGTMSAQHMLEHLILPLQFSRGMFEVPLVTPAEKVEKLKRIMLLSDAPLKKDFAAPFISPGLQELKFASFELAQTEVKKEIELFLDYMNEHPEAVFTHPIFGELNREEWYLFHRKHFTHHLAQFGLL
ncbi:MAG: DUF1569 domain-containing protein [Bacteroidia bacterium]|nr:DUF1569 domain-containing protein [Bacteroidia bacterium]